jgi:hypothetical protein
MMATINDGYRWMKVMASVPYGTLLMSGTAAATAGTRTCEWRYGYKGHDDDVCYKVPVVRVLEVALG